MAVNCKTLSDGWIADHVIYMYKLIDKPALKKASFCPAHLPQDGSSFLLLSQAQNEVHWVAHGQAD